MDEAEHRRRLTGLNKRVDVAGERIFDASERLLGEIAMAERRSLKTDVPERRLRALGDYVEAVTATSASWGQEALRVYAGRPTSAWARFRQRRRLRTIARTLERVARGAERVRS
ncbi:hypothetical protein [Kutzneria sp. NPDC052558]|uniref:hypothetical protein n=1 Tax=Kutzneria sp. NPDC052558 TaxID=3364121 RepID=UPI0037C7664C